MKKAVFKKLIKEALGDKLKIAQSQCIMEPNISDSVCNLLGSRESQVLIDAGAKINAIKNAAKGSQRKFSPNADEVRYINQIISVAKRELGADNEDIKNFESGIQDLMKIEDDIESTMESLKEDFAKYKLY